MKERRKEEVEREEQDSHDHTTTTIDNCRGQNIEMSLDQIQEPGPTSFTKPDLKFFDFEVKTLKCPEVKYKSPVT